VVGAVVAVVAGAVVAGFVITVVAVVAGFVDAVETVRTAGSVVEVLVPGLFAPGVTGVVEVAARGARVVPTAGATLVGGTLLRACGRPPLAGASIE
jgi:hypothetical protein